MDTPRKVDVEPMKPAIPPVEPVVKVEPKADLEPHDEAVKPVENPPVVPTTH